MAKNTVPDRDECGRREKGLKRGRTLASLAGLDAAARLPPVPWLEQQCPGAQDTVAGAKSPEQGS